MYIVGYKDGEHFARLPNIEDVTDFLKLNNMMDQADILVIDVRTGEKVNREEYDQ